MKTINTNQIKDLRASYELNIEHLLKDLRSCEQRERDKTLDAIKILMLRVETLEIILGMAGLT